MTRPSRSRQSAASAAGPGRGRPSRPANGTFKGAVVVSRRGERETGEAGLCKVLLYSSTLMAEKARLALAGT